MIFKIMVIWILLKIKTMNNHPFSLYINLIPIFISALLITSLSITAQNTVIKAGHFFDARNGKMLKNQTIVIQDGRIKEIGTNPAYSDRDRIVDLSNSWVLPGLMDCHVHITLNVPYRNVHIEQLYGHQMAVS